MIGDLSPHKDITKEITNIQLTKEGTTTTLIFMRKSCFKILKSIGGGASCLTKCELIFRQIANLLKQKKGKNHNL